MADPATSPSSVPNWIAYLQALLVPAIAVFGAYIGLQQWRTARQKLRIDLFEKRLGIFKEAFNIALRIHHLEEISDAHLNAFNLEMAACRWLLKEDDVRYLKNDFYKKALDFWTLKEHIPYTKNGPEKDRLEAECKIISDWFAKQEPVLEKKFAPYLEFRKTS